MKSSEKVSLSLLITVLILFNTGCGGRKANPVQVQQSDDMFRNCAAIEKEMQFVENEINRLLPKTEKTSKNLGFGVAGLFFFPFLFFMDLSEAEQVEINACRERYNTLLRLASAKQCNTQGQVPMPDFKDQSAWQQYQQQQMQQLQMQQQMNMQQQMYQQQMQQLQQQQQLMNEKNKN